jgi:phosphate transport system substrate-binding protein
MKTLLTAAAVVALTATSAFARDNVQVTGSSTVLPYATIVAEAFGENFEFPSPVVEGGGSGAGRKKLCEGVGTNTVDIANSSSKMKDEEWAKCEAAVGPITEVRIGYDGIVFASNIDQLTLTI